MMTRRHVVEAGLAVLAGAGLGGATSAGGVSIVHRIQGEGEPVLLIAGYSCDLSVWDVAAPLLAAKGFRPIWFNNQGVGHGAQFAPKDITIPAMARHALALLDSLEVPKAHVVGHSMGGQIAQELAFQAPSRLASLTLLSSWGKPTRRQSELLIGLSKLAAVLSPEAWQQQFLPWILTDAAYGVPGVVEQAVQAAVQNPDRLSPLLLRAQAHAIGQSDTSDRLATIKAPTLVAVGKEDILTPPAYSNALHQAISGSTLEVLPAAHGFVVEAAPVLAERLAAFFRMHPVA